jgi:hypothetical protein
LLASNGLCSGTAAATPLFLTLVLLGGCDGITQPADAIEELEQAQTQTEAPATSEGSLELAFSASPAMVDEGGTTTLTWSAANADTCSASGAWSGDRPVSGSVEVGPLTTGETYTLTCSGLDGSAIQMLSVPVVGPVTLSWVAPAENVDGSSLDDLAGYRIYHGTESRSYSEQVNVSNPASTSHTLSLPTGEYFFAMTAVDGEGNESAYSNEVIKTRD